MTDHGISAILGHIQAQTGAQHFATVSGLNNMFPGNGLQWVRDMFSLVWWVCQKSQPNLLQHVYKPHGIKETARTMGPSKVIYKCVRCSSVYATIKILEDMFVVRVL